MSRNFTINGEVVTLVKLKSPFGPFYTVHKKEKLLGAIEGVQDTVCGGPTWNSILYTFDFRQFKMPESKRTWESAVEQLFLFEWYGSRHDWLANI